ncbi:endonuclease domain-containing protein [Sphingomonas sp.]|uniref:endonuclease domain-containing protein n=1 Tax=Sphingomonas sp. TaxID=28214 RepID=UPI0025DC401D|nr:endonuclease domain-containing protein [Sphingomonas sp.]MBV9527181.1 endonuclease domain-containing protein [Sphingomonas sp.]
MPQLDPRPTKRAQELRNNATDAERKLWLRLSRRQLDGFKFSRQMPVGPFICDFLCRERMIVVELDGSQHAENPRDVRRTAYLEARGYRVVRFWNHEVSDNIDGVLTVILAELRARRSRFHTPLPLAGGDEPRSGEGVGANSYDSPTPRPPPASGRGSWR